MDDPQPVKNSVFGWVVIAVVIVLLGAIAIPNFLEGGRRPPRYIVQGAQRSLAIALDSYASDQRTYPAALWELTTPVAYITSIGSDYFSPSEPHRPFYYARFNRQRAADGTRVVYGAWILLSPGPDRLLDVNPARNLPPGEPLTREATERRLLGKTYDSTNGTMSRGDIVKWGGAF